MVWQKIDKQLNLWFGFDVTLGAEATKMKGMVLALKELPL